MEVGEERDHKDFYLIFWREAQYVSIFLKDGQIVKLTNNFVKSNNVGNFIKFIRPLMWKFLYPI